jgi:hypothetical protein
MSEAVVERLLSALPKGPLTVFYSRSVALTDGRSA